MTTISKNRKLQNAGKSVNRPNTKNVKYKNIKKVKGGYIVGKKRPVKVKSLTQAKKVDRVKAYFTYGKGK